MDPEDHVCLCFHVSQKKIVNFLKREDPPVASLLSECLGAGTGCQWCVPFLKKLHAMHQAGLEPDLPVSPEEYAKRRKSFHKTGAREGFDEVIGESGSEG
ncbi:MAG: bacterioferritin-associated ferredoxin [Phycisphaerales bacterium]